MGVGGAGLGRNLQSPRTESTDEAVLNPLFRDVASTLTKRFDHREVDVDPENALPSFRKGDGRWQPNVAKPVDSDIRLFPGLHNGISPLLPWTQIHSIHLFRNMISTPRNAQHPWTWLMMRSRRHSQQNYASIGGRRLGGGLKRFLRSGPQRETNGERRPFPKHALDFHGASVGFDDVFDDA